MAWIKNSRGNTVKDIFLHNMNVESLDVVNSWFEKSRNNRYFIKDLRKAADIVTNFKNDKVTITVINLWRKTHMLACGSSQSVEQRKESDSFHIIKHIKIGKSPP